MDWSECLNKKIVKESSVDKQMIVSLIDSSERKLKTDAYSPLNEITASTKIVYNYDSLREILEALALNKGYKIYNHECFVGFIKEVLGLERESSLFDKLRVIRNGINYYGRNIGIEEAREIIDNIIELRGKFLEYLDE